MKKILTLAALVASASLLAEGSQKYSTGNADTVSSWFISSAQAAQTKTYRIRVDGLTCPFCVNTTEKALRKIPGVKRVSTNLKKGVVTVCAAPSAKITSGKMRSLITKKGFTFRSMSTGRAC